jgi:BirA family biotin operon repressor/biotin-[acetyl-CoA-carboxylase] ligase
VSGAGRTAARDALDARGIERATGWRVVARARVTSTNDVAARLREQGSPDRVVVVADAQTRGRGRGGARFESPAGGLYASLLVAAPAEALPGPLVAAAGVALAEAVEGVAPGVVARLKWPNDLLAGGRKAGGILVEAASGSRGEGAPVIVGIGVNLAAVPRALAADVATATTCLEEHAGKPVPRGALLEALLPRVDARVASFRAKAGLSSLDRDWRARLAWVGERVRCLVGGRVRRGTLLDASLERGLLVRDASGGEAWIPMPHVREVRLDEPVIAS